MLEDIRKNIEKLIALYEAEKAENESLRHELRASEETGAALRERIMELESGINARYLADAFMADSNRQDAKERVDKLIREINKCISLMEDA